MIVTGLAANTAVIVVSRGVAGLASGVAFVAGASLTAHLASQRRIRPGIALGLYAAGAGTGITISGVFALFALSPTGQGGWQLIWEALGVLSLAGLAAVIPTVMTIDEPHHRSVVAKPVADAAMVKSMAPTLAGYFCFGLGYIAYITFIVALWRSAHATLATITAFWIALGLAAVVGSLAWGTILDALRGGLGPAIVLAVVVVGAVLPVLSTGRVVAMISGVVFGSSFLATATAVTNLVRRILPSAAWTWAFGLLTAAFGIGQSVGPSLTGFISDAAGGVRTGLALSSAILLAGVIVLAFQRERHHVATPAEEVVQALE